ncbi:MAG: methyltransferase domain-containing protein [Candidatus Binataceae bacterium]|nr:methyltransferase domain-containing protein [Candidatus Binataceae bacterium]
MNLAKRTEDDRSLADRSPGIPEPFFVEVIPLLPRGLALDVACGSGRHSLALARLGASVIALDHSLSALETLSRLAQAEHLCAFPLAAELENFPIRAEKYDLVMNFNFLDRTLIPTLRAALKRGGMLLFDTFLVDQAALGHPRNPAYLLQHYELRSLLDGMDLLHYREGLTCNPDGTRAWRAGALARKV